MSAPLDEEYFTWLCDQVVNPRLTTPSRTYWKLLHQLYTTEFVWLIPNDDNRMEDGKLLRYEFIDDLELVNVERSWVELGCSMLELLLGLARRLAFETGSKPRVWFWQMIRNIGIQKPDLRSYPPKFVEDVLTRVIFRTYAPDGHGGLFPLNDATHDQRGVELWYQLSAYLLERD